MVSVAVLQETLPASPVPMEPSETSPLHHPPPPPPPPPPDRSHSTASLTSSAVDLCRICHCEAEAGAPLISPCVCAGSLQYVHQSCLQQWIKSADTKSCELCKFDFQMTTKIKPFRKVVFSKSCFCLPPERFTRYCPSYDFRFIVLLYTTHQNKATVSVYSKTCFRKAHRPKKP